MKRAALCLLLLVGCAESGRRVPSSILRPATAAMATAPHGELAFVSERDGHAQVFAKRPGESARQLTDVDGSAFIGPIGPQGELVVVTSHGHGEAATEQLHLLAGGALSPMSPVTRFARNPSWLPDGRLVYESNLAGFRNLFLIDRDGEPEQLTDCEHGCFEPEVSPDGKRVAFASPDSGDGEIYVLDLETRHRQRLTWSPGIDKRPAWSPDGARLAFVSRRGPGARLFVMNADGSRPRALSTHDTEVREESQHAWSPDGTHIAFVAAREKTASLRVVRVADGAVVADAEGDWIDQAPAWTSDGEHLVFASNRDGNTEIYTMRKDATGLRRMTDHPSPDWLPRWR